MNGIINAWLAHWQLGGDGAFLWGGCGRCCSNGIQTYPFYNRACPRARGSGWYKLVDDYVKQMSASLVRPQEWCMDTNTHTQTHTHTTLCTHAAIRDPHWHKHYSGFVHSKGQHTKAALQRIQAPSIWLINNLHFHQRALDSAPVCFRRSLHNTSEHANIRDQTPSEPPS